MPHGKKKNTSGAGSIRRKTVVRNGTEYTYWEARFTTGFDPKTGKQKQRSITGKTQKEVAQKLRRFTSELDNGTYHEPCKMTVGEWLDIWKEEYLMSVKPRTQDSYTTTVNTHLKPAFGAMKLEQLTTHDIQRFYNRLRNGDKTQTALSAKTIRNIHGVLHKALEQAGSAWEQTGLVFTNELGHNLSAQTVYLHFKKLAEQIGCQNARFHDLRHSYAVAALQSGDDIKTVQENLGHHTAAFTLEVYGHVTEQMKRDSANRMQRFIQSVSGQ